MRGHGIHRWNQNKSRSAWRVLDVVVYHNGYFSPWAMSLWRWFQLWYHNGYFSHWEMCMHEMPCHAIRMLLIGCLRVGGCWFDWCIPMRCKLLALRYGLKKVFPLKNGHEHLQTVTMGGRLNPHKIIYWKGKIMHIVSSSILSKNLL